MQQQHIFIPYLFTKHSRMKIYKLMYVTENDDMLSLKRQIGPIYYHLNKSQKHKAVECTR